VSLTHLKLELLALSEINFVQNNSHMTMSVLFSVPLNQGSTSVTMTMTSDLRPASPPSGGMLSNPNLTKLYMSASCPELKAESVVSSSDEEAVLDNERLFERHDEAAFSMDPPLEDNILAQADVAIGQPIVEEQNAEKTDHASRSKVVKFGPIDPPGLMIEPTIQPSLSSISSTSTSSSDMSARRQLQWEFKGLTLWLELEEFDNDITDAVEDFSSRHSSPFIPKSHTTAIYGMEHLSIDEAKCRLRRVKDVLIGGEWPKFAKPTGMTSDIAEDGKPGQVCSIAWSELTLATNPEHEDALDSLYKLFYEDSSMPDRHRPWKPHNSIAYDNPETNALSLLDTVIYASQHPSLLGKERRVEAMSLWSTEGKMHEWVCIDRVRFW